MSIGIALVFYLVNLSIPVYIADPATLLLHFSPTLYTQPRNWSCPLPPIFSVNPGIVSGAASTLSMRPLPSSRSSTRMRAAPGATSKFSLKSGPGAPPVALPSCTWQHSHCQSRKPRPADAHSVEPMAPSKLRNVVFTPLNPPARPYCIPAFRIASSRATISVYRSCICGYVSIILPVSRMNGAPNASRHCSR